MFPIEIKNYGKTAFKIKMFCNQNVPNFFIVKTSFYVHIMEMETK